MIFKTAGIWGLLIHVYGVYLYITIDGVKVIGDL